MFISEKEIEFNMANISKDLYSDLVGVSNNFKTQFYNAGVMVKGKIYTSKVESNCNKTFKLMDLIQTETINNKYFLNDKQIEKFKFLKGSKRIPRVKPNGNPYLYSEGSMPFPDRLDCPARTMLTSESSIGRSTHVVEDYNTKKLRLLTPIECERIDGFPDDWTNTGMTDKKRYFMLGNALVVQVIKKIGIEIEKIIENEN